MELKSETVIKLDRFKPRPYQVNILDALENKGYKRVIAVWPRRSGKDIVAFNYMLRCAIKTVGVYFYIFPTYSQARKVIFDSITSEGKRFSDFIPPELLSSINSSQLKYTLINGSIMQLIGSDNIDAIVGTNPRGCVFSEYALQDPRAYQFIRPALTYNDGWALFISTPRGHNAFYELYQIALNNKNDFYVDKLTTHDTQHISRREIEREVSSGELSPDQAAQEYDTSFDCGIQGSYYAKYIDKMRLNSQIGIVPYETGFKVHTAWDIGNDATSIIFFQTCGQSLVRIIDCYENHNVGLEHYVKVINQKPWAGMYGKHFGPHDLRVKEWANSMGQTRVEKARNLGVNFTIVPNLSIEDGIECVRSCLSKIWINEQNAKPLLRSLENYRKEYDEKRKIYKDNPLHDQFSHYADAMRYLCLSLPKTRDGLSPQDLDRNYQEAVYGANSKMPPVFRDDLPPY